MKIIFFGAPGAGKGTQAEIVSEKLAIPAVSTGAIIREAIKNGTEMGKSAKSFIEQGALVPDEVVIGIIKDRLSEKDCENGFILDGFPRTIPQAEALTKALADKGEKIDFAINVEVPDESIVNRMSGRRACLTCGATYHIKYNAPAKENVCDTCGAELVLRDDDKPETVLKRLSVYHEQTQPLIDYYKNEGVLREVDGTQDMNKVFDDILAILQ